MQFPTTHLLMTQLSASCYSSDNDNSIDRLECCITDVKSWIDSNKLFSNQECVTPLLCTFMVACSRWSWLQAGCDMSKVGLLFKIPSFPGRPHYPTITNKSYQRAGDQSFSYTVPELCNSLLFSVWTIQPVPISGKALKTFFFWKYLLVTPFLQQSCIAVYSVCVVRERELFLHPSPIDCIAYSWPSDVYSVCVHGLVLWSVESPAACWDTALYKPSSCADYY